MPASQPWSDHGIGLQPTTADVIGSICGFLPHELRYPTSLRDRVSHIFASWAMPASVNRITVATWAEEYLAVGPSADISASIKPVAKSTETRRISTGSVT
jgi:hypothetical protein